MAVGFARAYLGMYISRLSKRPELSLLKGIIICELLRSVIKCCFITLETDLLIVS